jgi:hypothetical protein
MTALAVSAILVTLVVSALIQLARERSVREVVTDTQEEGRTGFSLAALDIRTAALGSPTGVLLVQDASGARVSRPAVQVFDNVAGGGYLPVKPRTDALLVTYALATPRAAVQGDQYPPANPLDPFVITVTSAAGFAVGNTILFGEYGNAGWATITNVDTSDATKPRLTLSSTVNLFPGRDGKLPSGSLVRPARARLYYVSNLDNRDQLVRVDLPGPILPATAASLGDRVVLADGFENFQLDCSIDGGAGTVQACGAGVSSPDPLAADATAALGAATARITLPQASLLRLVRLSAIVRSARPLVGFAGDQAVDPLDTSGTPTGVAAAAETVGQGWVRRGYQLELAIRNTSLEAL